MAVGKAELAIGVKRIDPCHKTRFIREIVEGGEHMRRHFVGTARRNPSEGIVRRQEIERIRMRHLQVFVKARYGKRQINVVRTAVVAVEPRRIEPPRVVRIVAEGIAVLRKNGYVAHEARKAQDRTDSP